MSDTIIIALLGAFCGSGVMGLIQFLITRKDDKESRLKKVEKEINKVNEDLEQYKIDLTRVQLLLLISLFPYDCNEILKVGEKYFEELKGNWYMGSIFMKWLNEQQLPAPHWFKENET